jgi:hypothetical protein
MRRLTACLLSLMIPVSAAAWGEKGHQITNRLAIDRAGALLPEFMTAGRNSLIYNGTEPDRWREEGDSPLQSAQAPDHFFNSELWGAVSTIAPDRYAFINRIRSGNVDVALIGYLPYAILENYGRLRNAFRQWRNARTAQDRESARMNALYYAGVLGHYVADGSQPLHISIHFNGWAANRPNPKKFTQDRRFHNRYEAAYVNRAISDALVRSKAEAPYRLSNTFNSIKQYLQQSFAELETLYELEKVGEFNPERPRMKGTDFIASELARAATMLSSLWYTAWLESGDPTPAR